MWVEPPGLAVPVLHRVGRDDALPGADRPCPAEPGLSAAEDLLLDDEALLAVGVLDQPRRPVAEVWVHVMVPQIERLQHMPVGIDNVVGTGHRKFPPISSAVRPAICLSSRPSPTAVRDL